MSNENEIREDLEVRKIQPHLPLNVMVKLTAFIETKLIDGTPSLAKDLRELSKNWSKEAWALHLRATALVIADLIDQGWTVSPDGNRIFLSPPGLRGAHETVEEAKARLRRSLQIGRERQLAIPSVHQFLDRFSKASINNKKRSSVLDIIDDGDELAAILKDIAQLPQEEAAKALQKVIRPVVEVCDEAARDPETGIRLLDIWRYFRHTWSLEYRSIPGRQLPILVRNAARPGRPVMGIALLASPVLRTRPRDEWIGWTPEPFMKRLASGELQPKAALRALAERIDESIGEIRSDDLANPEELAAPTERIILRLEQRGAGAAAARERQLQDAYSEDIETHGRARSQIDPTKQGADGVDWLKASEDWLFIRKRAETLARLLDAKRAFLALDWKQPGPKLLLQMTQSALGERAISFALQEVRKAGLASQIADLSVCGAVPPYNELLGGKLVALAMTSAETRGLWRERYEGQISLISSQMAGRPVSRPAELKIVTTTSLYGSGSSQYNRLRLNKVAFPDLKNDIIWRELAKTAGFGTVHLSAETVKVLRAVTEDAHKARRVNNRFGEGTSPRLRQLREGLDVLGITSNDVLHHATPRLFYACALVPDADRQLLGLKADKSGQASTLDAIADAWRRRWLLNRIRNEEVLERLKRLGPMSVKNDLLPVDIHGQYFLNFEEPMLESV